MSAAAGALTVRTEPLKMDSPARGSETTPSTLDVEWTAMTTDAEQGGATVISYNVQWDAGTAGLDWQHLLGHGSPSLATNLDIVSGVVGGTSY